jgi:hypothetical protein
VVLTKTNERKGRWRRAPALSACVSRSMPLNGPPVAVSGKKCYRLFPFAPAASSSPSRSPVSTAVVVRVHGQRVAVREFFSPGPGCGVRCVFATRSWLGGWKTGRTSANERAGSGW